MLRSPLTLISAVVLVVFVVAAITARWIAPYGVNKIDVPDALKPPGAAHLFGTDELGRDILSRVLVATHASLEVALASVTFALVVGVTVGIVAGYQGGWLDTVLMRVVDVMFAFPVLLLALAIVAVLAPGTTTTILAIGIVYTPIFARVARASTLSVRVEPFVAVSRTLGTGNFSSSGGTSCRISPVRSLCRPRSRWRSRSCRRPRCRFWDSASSHPSRPGGECFSMRRALCIWRGG